MAMDPEREGDENVLVRRKKHIVVSESLSDGDNTRLVEHPDGFYWQTKDGRRENGPFPTWLDAEQDMQLADEQSIEVGETLQEAGAQIGIADWIDPDTGELAEENLARLEDH